MQKNISHVEVYASMKNCYLCCLVLAYFCLLADFCLWRVFVRSKSFRQKKINRLEIVRIASINNTTCGITKKPVSWLTGWFLCDLIQNLHSNPRYSLASKPKAQLAARGFGEENLHEVPKDSPTHDKDTLTVTLAISATNKWELRSIDIKTTFLQGNKSSIDVYLKPPVEANCETNFIWKLKKCNFGLSDASLQ